jgi:ribonuclease E
MERMLINATRDEKRVALVQENVLFDFITERPGFEQKIGNIYLARITSIEPSLDAVFVEFGSERHGFLPLKEISRQYFSQKSEQYDRPGIRDLLRVGQELLIQVEKEERGNKGAALTTYISLAGSYLVLMPNSPRAGGISRRIEGDERDQLREILAQVTIPEGMGLIVRTAAIGRTNDELKWDLDVLLSHWRNIEEASKSRSAPALIHAEGNVVVRAIRDYVRQDTAEIIIDDETEYQNAKHYLEQIRPDIADRVKLYADTTPLFSRYGIEHQIETAYKRAIDLPSGASIVIDYTEALVSIDVNSARATKGGSIETTAFNTNIEAAEEIARQLRLRDIGGLIVIDFIDMLETKHQFEVEKHLTNALKYDRARIQIQRISRFGLLEMSRQRLRPSLRDSHQHVCPTCSGHGTIRSVETVALTLVRIIEEEALKAQTAEVVVQASTEASTYLLNEKRHLLAAIEKNHGVKVSVIPNPNLQSSNHTKKRIRLSDADESGRSSSDRLQEPTVEINLPSSTERHSAHKPAVQQMVHTRPDKAAASGGLFKRIWDTMFGQEEEAVETSADETFQQKPAYAPRTATRGGQRPPRRPRAEEGTDNRDSRDTRDSRDSRDSRDRPTDSRERSTSGRRYGDSSRTNERSDERSGQRSGDSRQRTTGQRQQRTGGRNASAVKPISGSKSTQYSENPNEDHYNEYSQKVDHSATTSRTKTPNVTDLVLKPTHIDKMADEAPITIKASTSSSHAPTFRSATSTTSHSPSSTSSATAGSASDRTTSSSSTSSSQRLASTTSYAPRSGSSTSVSPTQQRSTSSYSPSSTPSAASLSSGGLSSTTQANGSIAAGPASGAQAAEPLSGGAARNLQATGATSGGTASGSQSVGTISGNTGNAQQTTAINSANISSAVTSSSNLTSSTSGDRQSPSYSAAVSQSSGASSSGNTQVSSSGATQASGISTGNIQKVGTTSSGTPTSANIAGSSPTAGSHSTSLPVSGSASSSNQGTSSTSSSSNVEDNQKPLIVRASAQEDKPNTSTSAISPDKKDKENSDA